VLALWNCASPSLTRRPVCRPREACRGDHLHYKGGTAAPAHVFRSPHLLVWWFPVAGVLPTVARSPGGGHSVWRPARPAALSGVFTSRRGDSLASRRSALRTLPTPHSRCSRGPLVDGQQDAGGLEGCHPAASELQTNAAAADRRWAALAVGATRCRSSGWHRRLAGGHQAAACRHAVQPACNSRGGKLGASALSACTPTQTTRTPTNPHQRGGRLGLSRARPTGCSEQRAGRPRMTLPAS